MSQGMRLPWRAQLQHRLSCHGRGPRLPSNCAALLQISRTSPATWLSYSPSTPSKLCSVRARDPSCRFYSATTTTTTTTTTTSTTSSTNLSVGDPTTRPELAPVGNSLLPREMKRLKDLSARIKDARDPKASQSPGLEPSNSATKRYLGPMARAAQEYPSDRETRASVQRQLKALKEQTRQQMARQVYGRKPGDWRNILVLLEEHTPKATWTKQVQGFTVSKRTAITMLHKVDHTIWDIAARADCKITLTMRVDTLETTFKNSSAATEDNNWVPISIQGTDRAIEAAKAEIDCLEEQPHNTFDVANSITEIPARARGASDIVWNSSIKAHRPSFVRPYYLTCRYEDLPRPTVWTPQSLEKHVMSIVQGRLKQHQIEQWYGDERQAKGMALLSMVRLLESDETKHALTKRAGQLILHYMVNSGRHLSKQFRPVIQLLEATVGLDADMFNLMLQALVKGRNLAAFQGVLKWMVKHTAPTYRTWNLFMGMIESREVQEQIMTAMDRCKLLGGQRGRQMMAKHMIMRDLQEHRGSWTDLTSYLNRLDNFFGPDWVNRGSLGTLLIELARLGKFSTCLELLLRMPKMGVKPNQFTVAPIIARCRRQKQPGPAIAALAAVHPYSANAASDPQILHDLFMLFLSSRQMNSLAVVWRRACSYGLTNSKMRARVSDMYDDWTFLLPSAQATGREKRSRANEDTTALTTRPEPFTSPQERTDYAGFPVAASLHDEDMTDTLLEASGDQRRPNGPGLGPLIAELFDKRATSTDPWRASRPFHVFLLEAWLLDRELYAIAKEAKQVAEAKAMAEEASQEDTHVGVNSDNTRVAPAKPSKSKLPLTAWIPLPGYKMSYKKRKLRATRPSEATAEFAQTAAMIAGLRQTDTMDTSPPSASAMQSSVVPADLEPGAMYAPQIKTFVQTYGLSGDELESIKQRANAVQQGLEENEKIDAEERALRIDEEAEEEQEEGETSLDWDEASASEEIKGEEQLDDDFVRADEPSRDGLK